MFPFGQEPAEERRKEEVCIWAAAVAAAVAAHLNFTRGLLNFRIFLQCYAIWRHVSRHALLDMPMEAHHDWQDRQPGTIDLGTETLPVKILATVAVCCCKQHSLGNV